MRRGQRLGQDHADAIRRLVADVLGQALQVPQIRRQHRERGMDGAGCEFQPPAGRLLDATEPVAGPLVAFRDHASDREPAGILAPRGGLLATSLVTMRSKISRSVSAPMAERIATAVDG
jgi:hypothetical protein